MAVLIVAILSAGLIYALVALNTARELRTRSALEQNTAAAKISARLLDGQWEDLLLATNELVQKPSVRGYLRIRNDAALKRELRYAVDLVPSLLLAAVYDTAGVRQAAYPDSSIAASNASGTHWFQGVKSKGALFQGDSMRVLMPGQPLTEVIEIGTPVGDPKRPSGYLLALYRVGDVDKWLKDLGLDGSELYIVNSAGRVVDASTGADRSTVFTQFRSFRLAMDRGSGSIISHRFYKNDDADVGYAYAFKPGWAVIVARPVNLAMAPTKAIVSRLTLLGLLVFALLSTGGALILRLYRTQNSMALALTRQNAQLRQADQVKSDFLANVSHDLRTPLATMQLSISGLLDPGLNWEPEQVKDALRGANDSLDQISARVRNLLEMARLEAHIWPLNKQVCDLTDIVGAALERMKPLLAGRPLRLDFPENPLLIECDSNQIETVVVNLLENANKYSPPGASLGLKGWHSDEWLNLSIEDAGPGVDVDDAMHVFEKFYRSRRLANAGGTGLGLAICKTIVETHGGCIGVSNVVADGRVAGAQFWIKLPAMQDETRGSNE